MKKIRRIQLFFIIYSLIQFVFMVSYTPITGEYDLFPLFTWNIFRPYPAKYQDRFEMFFTNINGIQMNPTRMADLDHSYFPHINQYDFSDKVDKAGVAIVRKDEEDQSRLVEQIERSLLEGNLRVSFYIKQMWFEPITFLKEGRVQSEKVIFEKTIGAQKDLELRGTQ